MDLNLQIKPKADDSLVASYVCPCGSKPRLGYTRGAEHAQDGCCCDNEFAVGPDAAGQLRAHDGFRKDVKAFQAPWGERLQAAWTIGASVDPNAPAHDHDHGSSDTASQGDSHDQGSDGPAIDPVCGMSVDRSSALAKDLHLQHEGTDYYFCGRGCKLEFGDDPARYLDPTFVPSM
jgi:YHS domain-containing protein